jgi:hypothetical protein
MAPEARRAVERQLREAGSFTDSKLLSEARKLLEAVARNEPDIAKIVGVDLEGIKAASVRIEDITSAGAGVRVKDAVAGGDFVVSNVRAGGKGKELGKR